MVMRHYHLRAEKKQQIRMPFGAEVITVIDLGTVDEQVLLCCHLPDELEPLRYRAFVNVSKGENPPDGGVYIATTVSWRLVLHWFEIPGEASLHKWETQNDT